MTLSKNGNIKLGPLGLIVMSAVLGMLGFIAVKVWDISERVSRLEGWRDSTSSKATFYGP